MNKNNSKKINLIKNKNEILADIYILDALDVLGLYFKEDREFRPRNDADSRRFHVSLESGEVVELLVTGQKWYDVRAMQGGGGVVDLVRHLYGESFPQAVQRLHDGLQAVQGREDAPPPSAAAGRPRGKPAGGGNGDAAGEKSAARGRHLVPVRQGQSEYFVADILDWMPKEDATSMEHPLFSLKAGDKRLRVYARNGVSIRVAPGFMGHATIHDKDLWIYCISMLVAAKNRGEEIGRTVRFRMADFMRATNRDASGRAYLRAAEMLDRLKGTSITTSIVTPGYRGKRGFGLIDSWGVVERDGDNRMVAVEVTLPDWLFCSVDSMQVLTISRDYFRLRRPLDRRIYELARKHCGQQEVWKVSMTVLHEKSGSSAILRRFRFEVLALVKSDELPDYLVVYEPENDVVTFSIRKTRQEAQEAQDPK